ncbi:hypothetical protein ACNFNZ_09880 [Empedobacter brevis]|uniref:hypothetical protein n=1 Tax=Empedobacter brevis TaxID=247 RepID=UPI0023F0F3D5|nr:hypothetical protein [Empedobacter brevis]
MIILKQILQYFTGYIFLMLALIYFIIGEISIIGSFISLITALIVIPITRKFIQQALNIQFYQPIKYLVPFIGFILPLFFVNTNSKTQTYTIKEIKNDSIKIELDTLTKNDSVKRNKIITSTKSNFLTNSNNSEITTSNSHKPKNNSLKQAKINNLTSTSKKLKKNKRMKSHVKSYSNSSSSYCGHPNKTGGNCRRKVKGGGYCWQHS